LDRVTEGAKTTETEVARWLMLLMPREEGRISARAVREAETDLDVVRRAVERLIDGPRWLEPTPLRAVYVALHPTTGNGPLPDSQYQRHQDCEFINVHFGWRAFSSLPSTDRPWWLYDVVLDALRSPRTAKRLGPPPLREGPDVQTPVTNAQQPQPEATAPGHEGDGSIRAALAGVREHDLLVLRPFPAHAPAGADLELIERYDRELDELLAPAATWTVIDSEINAAFLRWVVGPAGDADPE
jgi:hypothetical protein